MPDNVTMIQPRIVTSQTWAGDIQVFGDLRQVEPNQVMEYFHMNSFQRKSFRWLRENHIPQLEYYYGINPDVCISFITVGRAGFNKSTQQLLVQMACIDVSSLRMQVLDNRIVALGRRGGKTLINPERRGTDVHGSRVLVSKSYDSILEPVSFTE